MATITKSKSTWDMPDTRSEDIPAVRTRCCVRGTSGGIGAPGAVVAAVGVVIVVAVGVPELLPRFEVSLGVKVAPPGAFPEVVAVLVVLVVAVADADERCPKVMALTTMLRASRARETRI
jgi:nitrate/nitrite transporter NarK